MGEIADAILNGDFDEVTGEYIGPGDGYPRSFHRKPQQPKEKLGPYALQAIQQKLISAGYTIIMVRNIDYGYQLRTLSGSIINIYSSGKIVLQGKQDEAIKKMIK